MAHKRCSLLGVALLLATFVMAQSTTERTLTLDNLIPGGKTYSNFVPKSIAQLRWAGEKYIYQEGDTFVAKLPTWTRKQEVVTLEQLNTALATVEGIEPLKALPYLTRAESGSIDFMQSNHYCRYDMEQQQLRFAIALEKGDENLDFEPQQQQLAVTNGSDLYIVSLNGERTVVGKSKKEGISFGTHGVHRNEFGIGSGTFWSPSGDALAYYRLDQRGVTNYPLVDVSKRVAAVENTRYPMAGMRSEKVKVGVYSSQTGKRIFLATDTAYCYQTNITWSPDGSELFIQELNREQNKCQLVAYSATTGERLRVLFTEEDDCYVEPENPLFFVDNDRFIYQSKQDGYNHLYLYNRQGELLKQLTQGDWMVTEIKGYDKRKQQLFITSTEVSPLESHLYSVSLKDGARVRLTADEGTHYVALSSDYSYFVDNYSNHATPRNIELTKVSNGKATRLLTAENPFEGYEMPQMERGTIKAADGTTDLHYRLLKPTHFDENKKYPVVVYVYGGPHAQLITNSWRCGASGWDIYMAQRGYVVFTLDSRGSANRGKAFEQVIHRQLGVAETQDQLCGIELLKSKPYVDADRIGVHGWSYGGFMTTNMMLRHSDIFKVGVAGGAVIDWKYYEVMYGERYMDTPKENRKGYKETSLLPIAGNLEGHLLMIHCDNDPVVVWQHTLAFLKSCIEKGSYPDYFVYPGHEHNVRGIERVHLHEKITRYFDDYLK